MRTAPKTPFNTTLASGLDPTGSQRYLLYLPLRAHVVSALQRTVAGRDGFHARTCLPSGQLRDKCWVERRATYTPSEAVAQLLLEHCATDINSLEGN